MSKKLLNISKGSIKLIYESILSISCTYIYIYIYIFIYIYIYIYMQLRIVYKSENLNERILNVYVVSWNELILLQ